MDQLIRKEVKHVYTMDTHSILLPLEHDNLIHLFQISAHRVMHSRVSGQTSHTLPTLLYHV